MAHSRSNMALAMIHSRRSSVQPLLRTPTWDTLMPVRILQVRCPISGRLPIKAHRQPTMCRTVFLLREDNSTLRMRRQ